MLNMENEKKNGMHNVQNTLTRKMKGMRKIRDKLSFEIQYLKG